MIPVAAPIRVQARLAAAADGPRPVLHASATAVYVDLDGWCVGLVSASATRVPCALWSTLPDIAHLAGRPVVVSDGTLAIGDEVVRIGRVVDPRATVVGRHGIPRSEPGILMTSGLDLPEDGRLTADHVATLVGRGPGLTPLGDDVLAGWLATRAALGRPDAAVTDAVRHRLGATTLLSATLLDCAIRGEVLPQLGAWLADPTATSADALLAVGATSGAGLLTGARLAIRSTTQDAWRAA
ncbi:hypothetical protein J2X46_000371 [Nocardioides sp. BE266]|uniref:oxamate carbamoyltransferase subunit AllH family protein n=1 Tax=Nocardioides sp. BE266 TaxID=2817725 RepID=UPI002865919A|nr:DUF2877 domain-containing protein [Nocardioides sp. BE266]MDR7251399.1 hypothetical protein [Nocardioides sp. BE266]